MPSLIYLPAREVLSFYSGFMRAYKNQEAIFDQTYYDLCLALSVPCSAEFPASEVGQIGQTLAKRLEFVPGLFNDKFYFTTQGVDVVEAQLVAEGFRKVGSLIHLIANGSLVKNSILFWDEPEANLNPKLIKVVADLLMELAGQGVQIFIATHDYLLTNELSIQAEYRTEAAKRSPVRFFAFNRNQDGGVEVQSGDMLINLDQNPIMEEFSALYERERELFYEKVPKG